MCRQAPPWPSRRQHLVPLPCPPSLSQEHGLDSAPGLRLPGADYLDGSRSLLRRLRVLGSGSLHGGLTVLAGSEDEQCRLGEALGVEPEVGGHRVGAGWGRVETGTFVRQQCCASHPPTNPSLPPLCPLDRRSPATQPTSWLLAWCRRKPRLPACRPTRWPHPACMRCLPPTPALARTARASVAPPLSSIPSAAPSLCARRACCPATSPCASWTSCLCVPRSAAHAGGRGGGGSTQVPGVSSTASCLLLSRAPSTLPSSGELTPASLFPTNPPRLTFAGFVQLLSLVAGKRDAPVAEVVSSVLELEARGPERRATTPEVRQVGECVEGGARRLMPSSLSCSAPPCGEVSRPLPTPHFSACIHPLQAVRFHDDRTTYTGEEGHEGWGQPGGLGWELLSHILPPPRCALCISPIPLLPPSCQACTSAAA